MAKHIFKIVKLQFKSPLHISIGKTNEYDTSDNFISSDTIKSALFSTAKSLFNIENAEKFFSDFRVSSAFPYYYNRLFFPKPLSKLPVEIIDYEENKKNKTLKKLTFIEKEIFEKILNNENQLITINQIADNGKYLCNKPEDDNFIIQKTRTQQKVSINAIRSNDPEPYYVEQTYFNKNCGLFFIIKTNDDFLNKTIAPCLNLLGDNGIGSYRTTGNGNFNYNISEFSIELPENANKQMCLSLYLPNKDEINYELLNNSAYLLKKRGGYIAGSDNNKFITLRKKSIYMFKESCVFPAKYKLNGKLANLKPDYPNMHDVWRDGKAIFIPIIINEND